MEKQESGIGKWLTSRKGQQAIVIIAFSIIPLLLLFTFTYLPFAEMVKFSFYKMKYATPVENRVFVGLKNYIDVFKRDDCFSALKLSIYYIGGALFQLALALYLATILSFKTKGGNLFKGFMFFPYLVSGIAIGFIFKFFYTRGYVFDTVLQWCGFQLDNLPYWLKDQRINNISLVATSVWRYFGQNMVLFIGAIMSVDKEMYEAADLDGANKFQQFIHIILPSIKTIVTLNVIMSITGSLSAFEPPYVITSGANGTGTYFVIMNEIAHVSQKVGLASAMAVVLLVIMMMGTDIISIYIFIQFMENIPNSLDESAIIDGCSYFGIYWRIILPLLKPAIVTSIILKGVSTYNEYYAASLYLQNKTIKTVAISLYTFTGPLGNKYNLICAGVIISLLPALIVFLLCQKQIYSGITSGAVKG